MLGQRLRTPVILGCFLLLSALSVSAVDGGDPAAHIRSHYSKAEVRIPMRDGVTLFAAVYTPNDASAQHTYPILLTRTPYSAGPYGADRYPSPHISPPREAKRGRCR